MTSFRRFVVAVALLCLAGIASANGVDDARKLARDGHLDKALARVERVLAAKPDDTQARFLKGVLLARLKRVDEALAIFERLTKDHPELPEPYNNLAVLYAARGDYDKARAALVKALNAHPSYATARENLGDIYAKLAMNAYQSTLQLDPSNSLAREKLDRIRSLFAPAPSAAVPVKVPPVKTASAPAAPPPAKTAAVTTTPSAPPAAPALDATERAAREKAALEAVQAWARAWAHQDVKAYLDRYAADFKPGNGETHAQWARGRRVRLTKPKSIEVTLSEAKVVLNGPDAATVTFRQRYRSNTYQDEVRKRITLTRTGDAWKITSEQVIK